MNYREFKNRASQKGNVIIPVIIIAVVYVVLFQFIVPANDYLPKPSILLESFAPLFGDYAFLSSAAYTAGSVFGALILITAAGYFIGGYLVKLIIKVPALAGLNRSVIMIPAILPAVLFSFWFDNGVIGEVFFLVVISLSLALKFITQNTRAVKEEYYASARSLDIGENKLYNSVIRNTILPGYKSDINESVTLLWGAVLLFEYIFAGNGLGALLQTIYTYEDISALIVLILFVCLMVYLSRLITGFVLSRIIFWEV